VAKAEPKTVADGGSRQTDGVAALIGSTRLGSAAQRIAADERVLVLDSKGR
jgi:hypothetical protein